MNPIGSYETIIDVAQPNILQGDANSQTTTNMLKMNPMQGTNPNVRAEGMALGYFSLLNRSGGAASVGIGVRIPNHLWSAGQWVDATTTYTDDTTDAQDAGAGDFALETTTNSDGYLIASRVPFNAVLIDVTTASVDAVSVARSARYSDAAGTAWVTLTTVVLTGAAANYATATETVLAFDPPSDWGVHVSGLGTNTPVGQYLVNVRATDAPGTTAGLAGTLSLYRIYFIESIANNVTKEINFSPSEAWMPHGDGLIAFFSTANAANKVTALVRPRS